jgi:hypothetical protein
MFRPITVAPTFDWASSTTSELAFTSPLLPLLLAPRLELEGPSVQIHAADAERIVLALVGAGGIRPAKRRSGT